MGACVGLEAAARGVRAYEPQVIPGLLQSEDYALAMLRSARTGDSPQKIDRRVHVRLARQSLLVRDDPIYLWVVLDEAVLSRPVGGDAIMRTQLERLIEAQALANVTIQVLPFAAGLHAAMEGGFAILDFPDSVDPDVVYVENATGGLFLEKEEELSKYHSIFDALRDTALSPERSTKMIEGLVEEPLWRSRPRDSGST